MSKIQVVQSECIHKNILIDTLFDTHAKQS